MPSLYKINNGFLGYYYPSTTEAFSGSDTAENFHESLKTKPIDWVYRNKVITYTRNKNGHRCSELENLNLDNYLLFVGCSHTEGIGVALEDSYAYITSKTLGIDYYNLALGGTGIDAIIYNLSVWFANIQKRPKALIIQWPEETRMLGIELKEQISYSPVRLSAETSDKYLQFLRYGWETQFFECRKQLAQEYIKTLHKQTHVFEMSDISTFTVDNGRDMHSGIQSNINVATFLSAHLKGKI